MKVGDLVKHYVDHDIGIIVDTQVEGELDEEGSHLIWWTRENCFGWYPSRCLELINESW